jgi:hypothetical protein
MARSKHVILGGLAAATLGLAACNPVANLNGGEDEIERIHAAYGRGDHDALYAMTGPAFRRITSRAQFESMLDVFDVRLGAVKSTERTGFNVNTNPSGTFTTIVMSTHFAKGDGQDEFVFSGDGDAMVLEGWHINSPNLMLTAEDVADERVDRSRPPELIEMVPQKGSN